MWVLIGHLNGVWVFQVDWGHTWEELTEPPLANPNGLYIPLRHPKKVFGLFASGESGKLVVIHSQEKCEVSPYHCWLWFREIERRRLSNVMFVFHVFIRASLHVLRVCVCVCVCVCV